MTVHLVVCGHDCPGCWNTGDPAPDAHLEEQYEDMVSGGGDE